MSYIKVVSIEEANTKWNSHCTHPMQSIEWARVRSAHGLKTVLVEEYTDHEQTSLSNVLFATIHPIPSTKYSVAYIPKSHIPSSEILANLQTIAKREGVIFAKFEPNIGIEHLASMPSDFKKSPHPIFTKHNQVLDLDKSLDVLMSSFHPKTRYNIKLAKKRGVVVKEMSDSEGYQIFEDLYFETCKRQKYRGHTRKYHKTIWKTLSADTSLVHSDQCEDKLKSRILVAFLGDKPLAAYELWVFKGTMYYVFGGSSTLHKEVMAANLIMWESILLAKSLGCSTFDMWGSLSKDYLRNDPWAGFTRFKEGYGTRFVEYTGSFDIVYSPLLYFIYNIVQKIRQKLI